MSNDGVRAVSQRETPSAIVWSAEFAQALTPYLEAAEAHRAAGRVEEAVAAWEAALRDVPGAPAPRRQAVLRRIRDASLQAAQRAVKAHPPDWRGAAAWLARWLRWVEGAGDDEKRRVLLLRGMMLHVAGDWDAALRCYEEAAGPDVSASREETDAWRYGAALLRLQLTAAGAARRRAVSRPVDLENVPSHEAAWERLRALERLLTGDVEAAAAAFPRPDAAGLPTAWALAGGVLAALARRWRDSVVYFRRALAAGVRVDTPAYDLHRFVFVAAAFQCAACGDPIERDAAAFVMAQRLPVRRPRGLFVDAAAYARWAAAVRRWQQRLWLRQAMRDMSSGDARRLRRTLSALARVQPHTDLARRIRLWLACTGTVGGAASRRAYWLRRSAAAEDSPRHLWRLSVLAAERFGGAPDVVERLHQLLERFPDDAWGLARWRTWMMKLAQQAVEQGRFKQALFQYVSLILRLPDDRDGWAGCAQVLQLMDEEERAADCWRQARLLEKRTRRRTSESVGCGGTSPADDGQVQLDILRKLLAEPDEILAADFPFAEAVLRRAVLQSLHEPDAYLPFLLKRWAEGSTSLATSG